MIKYFYDNSFDFWFFLDFGFLLLNIWRVFGDSLIIVEYLSVIGFGSFGIGIGCFVGGRFLYWCGSFFWVLFFLERMVCKRSSTEVKDWFYND